MGQLAYDKTFLLAAWIEGVLYGFLAALYAATMYIAVGSTFLRHDTHGNVFTVVSTVMFFMATFHISITCYRMVEGFTIWPGGPDDYFTILNRWDYVLKNVIYATQEMLGSAASIYRCWVLWNRNWRVVVIPCLLLMGSMVSGYGTCALFAQSDIGDDVFQDRLNTWIRTFFAVAVVQNILTTVAMAARIWLSHKRTAKYYTQGKAVVGVIRVLIESAALQLIAEIILLAFYCSDLNVQYIMIETITPVVGITFNAITIRLRLRQMKKESDLSTRGSSGRGVQNTIGSMPMRRIHVNITQNVENDGDIPLEQTKSYEVNSDVAFANTASVGKGVASLS